MNNTVEVTPKPRLKSRQNLAGIVVLVLSSFIDQIDAFAPYFMGHEQVVMALAGIALVVFREITGSPVTSLWGAKDV